MTLTIRPLHPVIGGEVDGVDLRQPLSDDDVAAINAGMDRFAVLVFPGQDLTDEQQIAFSRNFGDLEMPGSVSNITKPQDRRLRPELADVSNLTKDQKVFKRDDRTRMFNLGNRLWHSDSSFRATPSKYSILSARLIPNKGGNTEFADMRAAYDALDDEMKAEIADLVCEHSLIYSRGTLGFDELTEEERANFTPVRQSLVRTHPVTGRKSLYLSSHAGTIIDKWRLHDLVMWDNRQTMHRVRRFADTTEKRDMRRTTVAGDIQTVAQQVA
jgi:alpha-ketoglutarate-dependent 2,4-dichlorophenoxyacetate dioxygenase